MTVPRSIRRLDPFEAEVQRDRLRQGQSARDEARRRWRRRRDFRDKVTAAVKETTFVAVLIGLVVFVCWLVVTGELSPWQIQIQR